MVDVKKRERQMRRSQIANAAKEVFLLKGFRSTTIEDIARKAELSPATIYQYFKNKDELYASLNLESLHFLFNEIEDIYKKNNLSFEEKIVRYKEAMYNTFKYDPVIFRNILHVQMEDTLSSLSKNLLDQITTLSRETMNMIAETYEEGIKMGKLIEGNSMTHADIMWATFLGLVLWEDSKKRIDPKKDFLKPTLDKAFEIFIQGTMKKKTIDSPEPE